jgi:putative addiction module component (TIGR02574 family)
LLYCFSSGESAGNFAGDGAGEPYNLVMSISKKQLLAEALALPPADRQELADEILQSFDDPEIDAAWAAEAERRIADLTSGKTQAIPGDQVLEEARQILEKRRSKSA